MIAPEDFVRIVTALRETFDFERVEFTIEANPDDVVTSMAGVWRDTGVNRVSLGVQSFDEETLHFLGRCHDSRTAVEACQLIRKAFENWSIDLIFGANVPGVGEGATAARFEHDLEQVLAFAPPHVSLYALTVEPGTIFSVLPAPGVDDEMSLELSRMARAT